MDLDVHVQVGLAGEGLVTDVALEGPVPCMYPDMCIKSSLHCESFTTDLTFEGPFSGMRPHVHSESCFLGKLFATGFTLKGFLPSVHSHVTIQIVGSRKCLLAQGTRVAFGVPSVDFDMSHQGSFALEAFLTYGTFKCFFFLDFAMPFDVKSPLVLVKELPPTNVTSVDRSVCVVPYHNVSLEA